MRIEINEWIDTFTFGVCICKNKGDSSFTVFIGFILKGLMITIGR